MEVRHHKFSRITIDPEKCFGKPCIRGLRFPISSLLAYLASGMSAAEILKQWPELQSEDIPEALAYASWAMDEKNSPFQSALSA